MRYVPRIADQGSTPSIRLHYEYTKCRVLEYLYLSAPLVRTDTSGRVRHYSTANLHNSRRRTVCPPSLYAPSNYRDTELT